MFETMIDAMLKSMGFTREEFHNLVKDGLTSLQEMDNRMERIEQDLKAMRASLSIEKEETDNEDADRKCG